MKAGLLFFAIVGFLGTQGALAQGIESVYQKLESLNTMRESLASSLDPGKEKISEETFKRVCMPVGKQLKEWSQAQGFEARQIARKNRNPQHALTPKDQAAWDLFEKDAKLNQHKEENAAGITAYVRIPLATACLHCHGPKEVRPDFIKQKYPDDRAYDFAAGDLRAIYAVYMPSKPKQ